MIVSIAFDSDCRTKKKLRNPKAIFVNGKDVRKRVNLGTGSRDRIWKFVDIHGLIKASGRVAVGV